MPDSQVASSGQCRATEQPAVEQKAGDRKLLLVITVHEIRYHLGALRVRALLMICYKIHNKGPDLISCAVYETPCRRSIECFGLEGLLGIT